LIRIIELWKRMLSKACLKNTNSNFRLIVDLG
jgi:hypothetical protein